MCLCNVKRMHTTLEMMHALFFDPFVAVKTLVLFVEFVCDLSRLTRLEETKTAQLMELPAYSGWSSVGDGCSGVVAMDNDDVGADDDSLESMHIPGCNELGLSSCSSSSSSLSSFGIRSKSTVIS